MFALLEGHAGGYLLPACEFIGSDLLPPGLLFFEVFLNPGGLFFFLLLEELLKLLPAFLPAVLLQLILVFLYKWIGY